MPSLTTSWRLNLDRGPNWLIVRLSPESGEGCQESELAEQIAELLEQHFTDRVVLELEEVEALSSQLLSQLLKLHRRVVAHGGLMRLCGVSPANRAVLKTNRLDRRFPHFADRFEAVRGYRPTQPR